MRRAGEWLKGRGGWPGRGRAARRWVSILAVLVAVVWLAFVLADQYAEWRWFDSLGHTDALARRWAAAALLAVLVGGLSAAALCGNLILAGRLSRQVRAPATTGLDAELRAFLEQVSAGLGETDPRPPRRGAERGPAWQPDVLPGARARDRLGLGLLVTGSLVSVVLGLRASGWTEPVLRWWYGTAFGVTEPLFGRDVGAYVFVLPVVRPLVTWLVIVSGLALGLVGTRYLVQAVRAAPAGLDPREVLRGLGAKPGFFHLASLGAVLLLAVAVSLQVARAEVIYSTRGRAVGVGFPGFADMQVQSPAYLLMSAAAVLAAVVLILAAHREDARLAWRPLVGLGLVLVAGFVVPVLIQVFVVLPNDDLERVYLDQTIRLTRQAYALDTLQEAPPPATASLPADPVDLADVPLWGRAAIDSNLNQLQAVRPYYAFSNAQADRYVIDGRARLVLVGPRELNPDGLPSRSWSSTHLQFTHGYGAAIALAAEATPDGTPAMVDPSHMAIDRPEIYFGQRTASYAVVKTTQEEQDTSARYAGQGVSLGNGLSRFAFALALRDPSLLFSQAVTGDSEVLFHRQVQERVTRLAPFLQTDPEPYLAAVDGRLVWVVDAYTTSADYPGVERRPFGDAGANYVRNSVKVAVDAYDGSVRLFVADPADPVIRAEAAAYPGLLEPLDQMPAGLRAHLRYPRLLLATQADVLTRFHAQDAISFARGEDAWRIPEESFNSRLDSGPSYVLLGSELTLIQPFSPFDPSGTQGGLNLVALLVAHGTGAQPGGLVLQRYPREPAVSGPLDVDRRIDQQPDIAAQFIDWQRGGARILRGKPVAIPFGPQPVYAEAIYLQRGVVPIMPQLQRVVLALDTRLVMEPTLAAALDRLRAGQ